MRYRHILVPFLTALALLAAITDAPTALSFGDITAVPAMFLFDRSGKTARVLYGAPPDLHDQVEKTLDSLLK
jgi:hypothetical protein